MAIDLKDLNKDNNFWKEEEMIQQKALEHLRELKRIRTFDFHKVAPQTYDLKITGDPANKGQKATTGTKIENDDDEKPKKGKNSEDSPTKVKSNKKNAGGNDSESDEDIKPGNDKFDPNRQRKGKLGFKAEGNKIASTQTAVEHIAMELGHNMPVMTRGPEIELSTVKDVEDLKHVLAQHQINIPNHVLRRAIILPKDVDSSSLKYPKDGDGLSHNYFLSEEFLRMQEEKERLEKKEEKKSKKNS